MDHSLMPLVQKLVCGNSHSMNYLHIHTYHQPDENYSLHESRFSYSSGQNQTILCGKLKKVNEKAHLYKSKHNPCPLFWDWAKFYSNQNRAHQQIDQMSRMQSI
eukprot:TRINITY_DN2432_c0_g1_i10.p1 TRINITY_DN2432_c0_g1~~TRINITY_DN2432_c0_g1_i10.p1  ORF type:complete len:104 (-),score=6.82 TRINITY_DN2432_c0_g1_i10:73-384(-)